MLQFAAWFPFKKNLLGMLLEDYAQLCHFRELPFIGESFAAQVHASLLEKSISNDLVDMKV